MILFHFVPLINIAHFTFLISLGDKKCVQFLSRNVLSPDNTYCSLLDEPRLMPLVFFFV